MNRLLVGIVAFSFVVIGCKEKPATKTDSAPVKTMEAAKVIKAMGTARVTAAPMRPRPTPATTARPAFKPLAKLSALIRATTRCKKPVHHKCAEAKALERYTSDLWMNRIKLSDADKIRGFKTVATLVLDKNRMIRNFAAGVLQLNPFGLRDKIARNPELIEKIYIANLLEALPTLETFRSGWLMSYIPTYAPAYGLLDACFTQADKCKNKKDLYRRILKGMTKHARLKPFEITKKYAGDHSAEGLSWATAALSGLQGFGWKKKDAQRVCPWAAALLPTKLPPDPLKDRSYETMVLRYVDVLKRCQILDSEKHLEVLTQLQKVTQTLKGLKWSSKESSKTVGQLDDRFSTLIKTLKKKEKKKKVD